MQDFPLATTAMLIANEWQNHPSGQPSKSNVHTPSNGTGKNTPHDRQMWLFEDSLATDGKGRQLSVTKPSGCQPSVTLVGTAEDSNLKSDTDKRATHATYHIHGLEHLEREMSPQFWQQVLATCRVMCYHPLGHRSIPAYHLAFLTEGE
jgi:hypothetical protein